MWAVILYFWASSAIWKVSWCCCQKNQTFLLEATYSFLCATPIFVEAQCVNRREINWIGKVIWLKWLSHTCSTRSSFLLNALSSFVMVACMFGWSQGGEGYCLSQQCQKIWFYRLFNYIIRLERTQSSEMSILYCSYIK